MADRTVVVRFIANVSQARSQMRILETDTRRLGNAMATETRRAGQSAQTLGHMSANAGKLLLIGLGGALAVSAKAAIDFQSSFAGIRKTVDATESQFSALAKDMRDLSKVIPINVNELNRIGELGGQLGIAVENIASFTDTIAKIGVTTTLSTEQAAIGFARLANILQVPQSEISRMGSTIVELGNNFATTEDQILNFSLRIAPIGATVGLTADNVLALATAFSSVGIPAERGGTAVQRVFSDMADAVASASEDLMSFGNVAGMTADEFATLFGTDPAQAFNRFIIGLREVIDSGGNAFAVLRNLGITSERTRNAILGLASAEDLLTSALDAGSEAYEQNNALQEEAEKRFDTAASNMQLAVNAVNDLRIEIGEKLLPGLTDLVRTFTYLIGSIEEVDASLVGITAKFVAMAAVGGVLISGTRRLVGFFARLGTAMRVTGAAAGALSGAFGTIAVGWAALKVGEMIQRHITWKQRVEELTDAYTDLYKAISEGADTAAAEAGVRQALEELITDDMMNALKEVGIDEGVLVRYLMGDEDAGRFMQQQLTDTQKEAAALFQAFEDSYTHWGGYNYQLQRQYHEVADAIDIAREAIHIITGSVGMAKDEAAEAAEAWEHFLRTIGRHDFEPDAITLWGEAFADVGREAREAALEVRDFWAATEEEQEKVDAAEDLVDAIIDAGIAYNELQNTQKPTLQTTRDFTDSMRKLREALIASGGDLSPLIQELDRLRRMGLITDQTYQNFMSNLELFGPVARAFKSNVDLMSFSLEGFRGTLWQTAQMALNFARIASFGAVLGNIGQTFATGVSGGGGAVKESAEDLARDAAGAFLSTLQAELSYKRAQKALQDAQRAIEDLAGERQEVWRDIISMNASLVKARAEAARVTIDEQIDILRAQLDIFGREGDLSNMREELASTDEKLADADEALADALAHYNDEMERSIRLGQEHDIAMTDLQANLLATIRAYGLGEASFADVVDAEAALAEELARAGDAAGVAKDAEEAYREAQQEHARTTEETLLREKELKMEIRLAELELIQARRELLQLQKDSIGPTQDVLDLEEDLKDAKERLNEIIEEQKEATWALEDAQLNLISAYMSLKQAETDLKAHNDAAEHFRQIAREAGLAEQAVRNLMNAMGSTPVGTSNIKVTSKATQPPIILPPVGTTPTTDPTEVVKATVDYIKNGFQILQQGGVTPGPASHVYPALLHGKEAVIPLDRLEAIFDKAVPQGSDGSTIVVQLGNEEIARYLVDDVLDRAARNTRIARRVS